MRAAVRCTEPIVGMIAVSKGFVTPVSLFFLCRFHYYSYNFFISRSQFCPVSVFFLRFFSLLLLFFLFLQKPADNGAEDAKGLKTFQSFAWFVLLFSICTQVRQIVSPPSYPSTYAPV